MKRSLLTVLIASLAATFIAACGGGSKDDSECRKYDRTPMRA